jgi:hypothetical protein
VIDFGQILGIPVIRESFSLQGEGLEAHGSVPRNPAVTQNR